MVRALFGTVAACEPVLSLPPTHPLASCPPPSGLKNVAGDGAALWLYQGSLLPPQE